MESKSKRKLKKVLRATGRGFIEGASVGYLSRVPLFRSYAQKMKHAPVAGDYIYREAEKYLKDDHGVPFHDFSKKLPLYFGAGMAAYRTGEAIADQYVIPKAKEKIREITQKLKERRLD